MRGLLRLGAALLLLLASPAVRAQGPVMFPAAVAVQFDRQTIRPALAEGTADLMSGRAV